MPFVESLMRLRVSLKLVLLIFTVVAILTIFTFRSGCVTEKDWTEPCKLPTPNVDFFELDDGEKLHQDIDCFINDEVTVSCRRDKDEVYIPFSFLRKYFEVYGKIVKHSGVARFEWQHSYSKVYFPKQKYNPSHVFLWFENYNVEVRDRVKCISGIEGVPVSTQWDSRGHFYPIQIAQFGLSHFSKNLTDSTSSTKIIEDGEMTQNSKWSETNDIKRVFDSVAGSTVVEFKTQGLTKEILSVTENLEETTFNCDVKLISNASVTVVLSSEHSLYKIHYVMSDILLTVRENDVYYGLGTSDQWKTLTRDLVIDWNKGLSLMQVKRPKPKNLQVRSFQFHGFGRVDNISLSSTSHMAHFFASANWFVNHQDKNGGWPIKVTRKLSNGMLELSPGWYSAMAQGQAMSLLTRAFQVTGDLHYLEAALRAIKLFYIRAERGGILTTFLGKYVWYEEYPTIPSSYVLNGFIYSLFGLYDLEQSGSHQLCREAGKLFQDGLFSLKRMLPFFDTGSGSVYDLRHYSLGVAPNLARWDYHSTHINQLLFLNTIHEDSVLKSFAERWTGYMKGKKAPHN